MPATLSSMVISPQGCWGDPLPSPVRCSVRAQAMEPYVLVPLQSIGRTGAVGLVLPCPLRLVRERPAKAAWVVGLWPGILAKLA